MDGSSEGGAEIGWARGDVAEMPVMGELANVLDVSGGPTESVEDLEDASSLLHRNNSELVLLVAPDVERFLLVHEDASSGWPVSVEIACFQESISLFEKDMIGDQLVLNLFAHTFKWVESTSKITLKSCSGRLDLLHY